jgi:hypothetical protein
MHFLWRAANCTQSPSGRSRIYSGFGAIAGKSYEDQSPLEFIYPNKKTYLKE